MNLNHPSVLFDMYVASACKKHGVDKYIVQALIEHESAWEPFATRFEPEAYARGKYFVTPEVFAKRLNITEATEKVAQYHSYGLFQIMGFKLRELGYEGHLVKALDPLVNADLGCSILRKLFLKYNLEDAISAYNQGSPRKDSHGIIINYKNYVGPILKRAEVLKNANA